jgi:DNA repair exonuclease SbcCD nuclease subunit
MHLLITADWHLRTSLPRCRLDEDWMETQRKALRLIGKYSGRYDNCPIIVIGDIFHSNNDVSHELITMVQDFAVSIKPAILYLIPGNHDLPYHSMDNIHRSAIGILLNSDNIKSASALRYIETGANNERLAISAEPFGMEQKKDCPYVFEHILCFPDKKSIPPGAEGATPQGLLKKYSDAHYIFTGDYHQFFEYHNGDKLVCNPGCLLRQAADLAEYKSGIVLFDSFTGAIKRLLIRDDSELVTDEYLEKQAFREGRIEAFIEKMKNNEGVTLDFIFNVKTKLQLKKVPLKVKELVEKLLEDDYDADL